MDLIIETYIDTVFDRKAALPEFASSGVQRLVLCVPYYAMVSLPQLAHVREAVSEALASQSQPVEFSIVSTIMAAALAYAVPVASLEQDPETQRMPAWTKPPEDREILLVHVGLGFSTCAGFHITTEDNEHQSPTMVALSQKSVAVGTRDFVDCVVDSRKFASAISRHLTEFQRLHPGGQFNHNKDFVYKSFETYMAVWAERIEQQVKASRSDTDLDAILVREDSVDINFSMYSDYKATFKLSVMEIYQMCRSKWETIQNLVVAVSP
jgi:hypothetical protein